MEGRKQQQHSTKTQTTNKDGSNHYALPPSLPPSLPPAFLVLSKSSTHVLLSFLFFLPLLPPSLPPSFSSSPPRLLLLLLLRRAPSKPSSSSSTTTTLPSLLPPFLPPALLLFILAIARAPFKHDFIGNVIEALPREGGVRGHAQVEVLRDYLA